MAILSILQPNGILFGHFVISQFWYVLPIKIWQPWSEVKEGGGGEFKKENSVLFRVTRCVCEKSRPKCSPIRFMSKLMQKIYRFKKWPKIRAVIFKHAAQS
jgi:hypothetical protein